MMDDTSTARRRDLGRRALLIRQQAGLTALALSKEIGVHAPTLTRFENGQRHLSDVKFIQYLTFCGMKFPDIEQLLALANLPEDGFHHAPFEGGIPDELIALIVHETTANTIEEYEHGVVPGLLQSRDYASALLRSFGLVATDQIEERVERRLDRQSVLDNARTIFFIGENVLRSVIGGHRIMHDQMMKLYFACARENCSIRVVPVDQYGAAGVASSFRLMTFADHGPVASQDLLNVSAFLDNPEDVAVYREALERIGRVALPAGQSQAFIAHLADEYGRAKAGHDAGDGVAAQ